MKREKVARVFAVSLLLLTLYLLAQVLRPFFSAIVWALFFVTVFHPVYDRLNRWLGKRDWVSSILLTTLITTLIVLPGVFLVSSLSDAVPPLVRSINLKFSTGSPTGLPATLEAWVGRYVKLPQGQLHAMILTTLSRLGDALTTQIQPLVQNALATLVDFLVMILTMSVLFVQGRQLIRGAHRFLPLQEKDRDAAFKRFEELTRAIFYGVILTAALQGIAGGIGWMIVGLSNPLLAGLAMFFSALIPFVGTALIWVPGAMYLYSDGSPGMALLLLLWGVLIVSMIDTFLRPIFISGKARIHTLLVFFGIFGGMTAFGLKGLFVGPLVIALTMFLVEVVRRDLLPDSDD
ncbi:MAG: AI-2E family transporter [Pseudomonadota bacterium]